MHILISKFNFILLSIFFLSFASYISAQNDLEPNCGTLITTEIAEHYKSLKSQLKVYEQDFIHIKSNKGKSIKFGKVINSIPVKAHIIRYSDGSGGLSVSDLNNAIENLNSIYTDAFMSFYLYDGIDYINNDNLCQFKKGDEKTLARTNYTSGLINIYFTDYVENASNESICGYTDNRENKNTLVIKNKCAINQSSLAHELGHFFSLIHTHGADNGKITSELVNGSNCDTDGDGICDTPADPKLSSSKIDNFCGYKGQETDAQGDRFNPDTENIMSYSRKACRNHFTQQQLARMYAYYEFIKDRFISQSEDPKTSLKNTQATELKDIKIFPNPIKNNSFFVKTNNTEAVLNYTVSNLVGQVFLSGALSNQPIDMSRLSSGTYLFILESEHSRIVKKIIK